MNYDFTTLAGISAAAKELNKNAHEVGLEFWFQMDYHWDHAYMTITKGIGPGCRDIWGNFVGDIPLTPDALAKKMVEAAEVLEKYQEDRSGELVTEITDLAEKLKAAKAELRKLRKNEKANV